MAASDNKHKIDTKVSHADLVTETDLAVEKHIFLRLLSVYPDHKTIGEEATDGGARCVLTDTPTWIVDPIDGTMNSVHRCWVFEVYVSIGLVIKQRPAVGVIFNPYMDDLFTATLGGGACWNGQTIHVSSCDSLRKGLLATEFGNDRSETSLDTKFANMRAVISEAHGIRCTGSAALDMCTVAAGHTDAFVFGMHCWDVAAAVVIVREAGGLVLNVPPNGTEDQQFCVADCLDRYDMMRRHVLAVSTPELAREIVRFYKAGRYTGTTNST